MKLDNLNESRARVITRSNGDRRGFYTSEKNMLPFVTVTPSGNDYIVISLTSVGTKTAKLLQQKDYMAQRGYAPLSDEETSMWEAVRNYMMMYTSDGIQDFPSLFDYTEVDRVGLYKLLMNKHRIGPAVLEPRFGPMPEFDDNVQYGDVSIIPTEGMNAKSLSLVKSTLDDAKTALAKYGFSKLISGKFRIGKLNKNVCALYQYGSALTTLSMPMLRKGNAVKSIIHEMGHKYEDQMGLENTIIQKWNEIAKAGNSYTSSPVIHVGDQLTFPTPTDKSMNGIVMNVASIVRNGVKLKYETDDSFYSVTAPWGMFDDDGRVTYANGDPIEMTDRNPWFPTKYSTTDPHEFFAENFLYYIRGKGSDEFAEWMNTLPPLT